MQIKFCRYVKRNFGLQHQKLSQKQYSVVHEKRKRLGWMRTEHFTDQNSAQTETHRALNAAELDGIFLLKSGRFPTKTFFFFSFIERKSRTSSNTNTIFRWITERNRISVLIGQSSGPCCS